jgi:DNA-binding NarL/FixJ family response regulator
MVDTAFLLTGSRELAVGLAALLLSIPPLRHVERVREPDAILDRLLKGRQPALVVLDTEKLGPATAEVVEKVQTLSPETRCIVLSDTIAEQRELTASGVEPVVVKGLDAPSLAGAIEELLSDSGAA